MIHFLWVVKILDRCSQGCSTNTCVINWLIERSSKSYFVKISSKHCLSQTERAWELKFWENVQPSSCVKCPVSGVTCHMSDVTFHFISFHSKNLGFPFLDKFQNFFFFFRFRKNLKFAISSPDQPPYNLTWHIRFIGTITNIFLTLLTDRQWIMDTGSFTNS